MSGFIVNILEDFLGDIRKHNESSGQISFDCPACSADKGLVGGDGKGNLEVNYNKGVYKCWACKDYNNMSGYVPTLIKKYGNKNHLDQYRIFKPDYKDDEYIKKSSDIKIDLQLPKTFTSLSDGPLYDPKYKIAMKYLAKRRITQDIIDYYRIGYTSSGKYFLRIIIPSYDEFDELNYFSGRAFSWVKPKYMNCVDVEKTNIIFNEGRINWDSTIYLVEGPFDHIVTPNSIPLLGKYLSDVLFEALINKAKGNIVIVLDGEKEARLDAENIYRQLFYSPIGHLVRIIFLKPELDLAKIHQLYGPKGIIKTLSNARKLKRFSHNDSYSIV